MTSALVFLGTFLVIGVLAYYCDAVKGVDWYRAWYKLTHKEPLPVETSRGFIVGRKASQRIWTAVGLAFLASALLFLFGERSLITLFWLTAVESFTLFFGFFLAGLVHLKYKPEARATSILNTLDDMESGAIDPTATVRAAYEGTMSTVAEKAKGLFGDLKVVASADTPVNVPETHTPAPVNPTSGGEAVNETQPEKPKRNFADALKNFEKS